MDFLLIMFQLADFENNSHMVENKKRGTDNGTRAGTCASRPSPTNRLTLRCAGR